MASIAELLARAAALRDETALNSISPDRAGGIMYDTLVAMNELWLQQGAALVISKIYASVEAMEADTAPVSDLTGQALRPGQIVVIASSDEDNGSVYRYDGTAVPSWSAVGNIGAVPVVDDLESDSSILALAARQGKVLNEEIGQLGQEVAKKIRYKIDTNSWNGGTAASSNTEVALTDADFDATKPYLLCVTFPSNSYRSPIRTISVGGNSYPVKYGFDEPRNLEVYDTADSARQFIFLYVNGVYYLLNPTTDKFLNITENTELGAYLEIGTIGTSSGGTGTESANDKRERTKVFIGADSDFTIHIKSGYKLINIYKYPADGGRSVADNVNLVGPYDLDFQNYSGTIRLLFQKQPEATFDAVENTGSIVVTQISEDSNKEILSLTNTPSILLIGASYVEGRGSVRDKSLASYLSALYDWNVQNYSYSGSAYIKHLELWLNNTTLLNGNKASDITSGGICFDFLCSNAENPYFQYGMDGKYTEANIKRFYSIIRGKGYDVIPFSYFDQGNCTSTILHKVADEMGLQMVDILPIMHRVNNFQFTPFYFAGHYGTREVAKQFQTIFDKANVRRARTSLKVYRARVSSDIDNLLYTDAYDRLKKWREISIPHSALPNDKNNFVDRLDTYYATYKNNTNQGLVGVPDEYNLLRNKTALAFGGKAMIEMVLPSTANGIKNFELHLNTTASKVYVRKYIDNSLVIPTTPASAVMRMTDVTGLAVNDTLTCPELGDGVEFTITLINGNYVICSADGDFNAPGATNVTVTKTGGGTYTCTHCVSGVPDGYIAKALAPNGMWEQLTITDGVASIADMSKYMDYDKVTFLLYNDGNSFTLTDVFCVYDKPNVGKDYHCLNQKDNQFTTINNTVAKEIGFASDSANYTLHNTSGNSMYWDGQEMVGGTTYNHIPLWYRDKVASILRLKSGDSVEIPIGGFTHKDGSLPDGNIVHYRLRIVARYFPAGNYNTSAQSFTVTPSSFDFARLGIKYNIGDNNALYTDIRYLPASFVEKDIDIWLDAKKANNKLILEALDDNLELLYLKLVKLNTIN